jgi:hypothetical protein
MAFVFRNLLLSEGGKKKAYFLSPLYRMGVVKSMSGVFNIVDSLRGSGYVAPVGAARSAIYKLFNEHHGRPAVGEECDRLDVALDGLLKSNVGFEHTMDEVQTWHNMNYAFDDPVEAAAIQREYGIDAVVSAQGQQLQQQPSLGVMDKDVVDRWVERAYRLAMGNRGDEDIAWMAQRYANEARPRRNAMDIATGRSATGPHADVTASHPHREVRSGDTRKGMRNAYFMEMNPTINRPDPMSSAPPNI